MKDITSYVKYNYFHKEQKASKQSTDNLKDTSKLHYDKDRDIYICPIGQQMNRVGSSEKRTANGYKQTIALYEAQNCNNCPLRGSCHKSASNRRIQVNHDLNELKDMTRENLLSDEGIKHRKQRPADVEAVFGNLKQNKNFKRFMLRGIEKVEIETGLIALAHNLKKIA